MRPLICLLLLLMLPFASVAADKGVRVFALKQQSAERILPQLEALLPDEVKFAGTGARIVATGAAADLDRAADLIRALDVAGRQWRIRIVQQLTGSSGRGHLNRQSIGFHLSNLGGSVEQSLVVLEGDTGFIAIGREEPFIQAFAAMIGESAGVVETIDYRRVQTGFTVRPQAVGEEVELLLVPTLERIEGEGREKRVLFHQSATRIRLQPGHWVDIGAGISRANMSGHGLVAWRAGNRETSYRLLVRADPVF